MITKSFVTARYAETDQMGVIHHSVYAVWYELARTDFIKKVGISYSKMEEMGILLPLSELTCKYHQATLYEDEITIETRILALTPSRLSLIHIWDVSFFIIRHQVPINLFYMLLVRETSHKLYY